MYCIGLETSAYRHIVIHNLYGIYIYIQSFNPSPSSRQSRRLDLGLLTSLGLGDPGLPCIAVPSRNENENETVREHELNYGTWNEE